MWRGRLRGILAAALAALSSAGIVSAQTWTWTGGGIDNNWTTAANWDLGVPANDGSADIRMAATAQLNSYVNVPWNLHSLTFASGAPTFSLAGSELTVGQLVNQSNVNQSFANHVVIQPNGKLSPGPADHVGAMRFGGLTLNSGTRLDIKNGDYGLDWIDVTDTDALIVAGPTYIYTTDIAGAGRGEYAIIDYNGAPLSDSAISNLQVSGFQWYYAGRVVHNVENTSVDLRMTYWQAWPQWDARDGSWGDYYNWQDLLVPGGADYEAMFWGTITASTTVTLDGDRTIGHLFFENQNTYTIAQGTGGTLTLDNNSGTASIEVLSGSHVISAPLSIAAGRVAVKLGKATLTISGPQSHGVGSTLEVRDGKLNLNSNAGRNLALRISGGFNTSVVLGSNQELKELSINFAASGTQSFDLHTGAGAGDFHTVSVYADDLDAAELSLEAAIRNANANLALDPHDGIFDSGLRENASIGMLRMQDRIYIRSTRRGDVNLDGKVTISDFIQLASHYNTYGTATWGDGDLNYDQNVTIADYIDLASNFNQSYAGESWPVSDQERRMLADFETSIVPEPGRIMLVVVGFIGLRRRAGVR